MKGIPQSIRILIIFILVSILLNLFAFLNNFDESAKILNDTINNLSVNPKPILIAAFCFMALIQSLFALGLFLRQNWVRIFYLIITFIGIPFTLTGILDVTLTLTGVVRIFSAILSLYTIYALLIHKDKNWFLDK